MRVAVQNISTIEEGTIQKRGVTNQDTAAPDSSSNANIASVGNAVPTETDHISTETSPLVQRTKSKDNLGPIKYHDFSNSVIMNFLGISTWAVISFLNIYMIVQYMRGEDVHF